jgi:serine/threonine protein kinase
MNLVTGGDLRYQMTKMQTFTESQSKFLVSCLILGLEAIHANDIIHRDIKPENLVLDYKGYLKITDFGIAKKKDNQNLSENSGTPGYMAPEVLFNKNHDYSVDFFALGVIGYEIIMRKRPYLGKDKKELRKEIISRQAKLNKEEMLIRGWSNNCADFINDLLQRKKEKRLGFNGIHELKEHPWLKNFNWNDLINKKMEPNWKPPYAENYYHNFKEEDNIGEETEL